MDQTASSGLVNNLVRCCREPVVWERRIRSTRRVRLRVTSETSWSRWLEGKGMWQTAPALTSTQRFFHQALRSTLTELHQNYTSASLAQRCSS